MRKSHKHYKEIQMLIQQYVQLILKEQGPEARDIVEIWINKKEIAEKYYALHPKSDREIKWVEKDMPGRDKQILYLQCANVIHSGAHSRSSTCETSIRFKANEFQCYLIDNLFNNIWPSYESDRRALIIATILKNHIDVKTDLPRRRQMKVGTRTMEKAQRFING
jgi:hypothetical protein